MKINLDTGITENLRTMQSGGVVIATKIKKVTERIDLNGNVIDPETKQVLKPKEE